MKFTQLLGPAALACAMAFTVGCKDDVSAIPTMKKEDVIKIYKDKDAEKFRALFKDGIGENEQFEGMALTIPCVLYNWSRGLEILNDEGYDLNTVCENPEDKEMKGTNALFFTINKGRIDEHVRVYLVRKLLELGADPNFACTLEDGDERMENFTPLIVATMNQDLQTRHTICKLLLGKGANVNAAVTITSPRETIRISPIFMATVHKDVELIRILKAKGADPNYDLGNGATFLSFLEQNHAPDEILNALRN